MLVTSHLVPSECSSRLREHRVSVSVAAKCEVFGFAQDVRDGGGHEGRVALRREVVASLRRTLRAGHTFLMCAGVSISTSLANNVGQRTGFSYKGTMFVVDYEAIS
jgi:hypothetical protein